jgi:membrane protein EpsK
VLTTIRNAAANIAGYVISIAVGLFFTPYVVGKLGVVSYGVVPLVMSLFVWAGWISLAVNWSVGRYATIALARGDLVETAVIFNTSLMASVGLGLLLIVVGFAVAPFAGTLLRLPVGTERSAGVLIVLGAVSTAFAAVSGVVEVAFFCLNRFDLRAALQLARSLGTVILVLALFGFFGARIEWVGLGSCVAAVLAAVAAYLWGRRLVPSLTFRPRLFRISSLRAMMATNSWIVVDQVGTILMLNINLLLMNRFFGPTASAEYALAGQWEGILRSVMTSITVFTPQYLVFVARNDIAALRALTVRASRFVALVVGTVGGILIGLATWLPRVWLHRPTALLGPLMVGLLAVIVLNAAANPLYGVWQALNRVKVPSFATLGSGLVSVALSVLLALYSDLGPWALIIGAGVAFTLRNLFFTFQYAGHLVALQLRPLLVAAASGIGACAVFSTVAFLAGTWIDPQGWPGVVVVSGGTVVVAGPIVMFTLVSRAERKEMMSRVKEAIYFMRGPNGPLPCSVNGDRG